MAHGATDRAMMMPVRPRRLCCTSSRPLAKNEAIARRHQQTSKNSSRNSKIAIFALKTKNKSVSTIHYCFVLSAFHLSIKQMARSTLSATAFLLSLLLIPSALSFGIVSVPAHHLSSSSTTSSCLRATTAESEAEALLRRARELKAAAAEAEKQVHDNLLSKKAQRNAETDKVIDHFFPHDGADGDMDLAGLVQRIKSKRPSSDLLLRVVDRLHERECAAQGLAHVEPSVHHDHTDFHVIKSDVDEKELKRVGGLIDRLVDAAKVLDEEWYREKQAKGQPYRNHNELVHWAAGDVAKVLDEKAKDLRREHDDRFKKRQAEFFEAARKKDKQKYYEQEF